MTTPKGDSRLTVDISTALHARLRKEAKAQGITIRQIVTEAIVLQSRVIAPELKPLWYERFKRWIP